MAKVDGNARQCWSFAQFRGISFRIVMHAPLLADFQRIAPRLKVLADLERLTGFETDAFISHRELGGMHVRGGEILRVDIPRF